MPKYMVITKGDEGTFTSFFENINDADNCRMDAECGMGWYAEVYERTEIEEGMTAYQFLYS